MYFFDTYALVEMALQNPSYGRYIDFALVVTPLNVGEYYLYMVRTYGHDLAKEKLKALSFKVAEITQNTVIEAAEFKLIHNKKEVSWADCIGYVTAQKLGLRFLTGDSQFKGLPNVEFVK